MNEIPTSIEQDSKPREMTANDVSNIVILLEDNDIETWIDGGWGVDALLGEQTRSHGDVDIVVKVSDLAKLREVLKHKNFTELEGGKPWNFVMSDGQGHEIDVHAVIFDEKGNGLYGPQEEGKVQYEPYPASSFAGRGSVADKQVKCLSADYQVASHTGYELDEDDFCDVKALHERFGIKIPADYDKWL